MKRTKYIFLIISAFLIISFFIKKENDSETLTITFAGDTMLGRLVNEQISRTNYKYIWGDLLPILCNQSDLNIINLETTLTKSINVVPKVFNFKADPDKAQALKEGCINVVTVANNHIKDFNVEGLIETIQTLKNADIKYVGAGLNIQEAKKPLIIEKNGIKIGIIGYTDNEPDWIAMQNKPGTNYIKVGDIKSIQEDIKNLRKQVDILIITSHWGPNMRQRPSQDFIDFAHKLIDAGADIIHGHSAHVFQGIEIYKNKLIMYDTGDFVDDYAIDPILRNDQSFLFIVNVSKKGIKNIQLIPIIISNMQVNLAQGSDFKEITEKMKNLSLEFETHLETNTNGLALTI